MASTGSTRPGTAPLWLPTPGHHTRITTLIPVSGTTLTDICGVGDLLAAEILGEVGIPVATPPGRILPWPMAQYQWTPASANKMPLTHRGANRRLNRAIHIAAINPTRRDSFLIARPDSSSNPPLTDRLTNQASQGWRAVPIVRLGTGAGLGSRRVMLALT